MSAFTSGVCCLITGVLLGLALQVLRDETLTEANLATANELVASLQTEKAANSRQLTAQVTALIDCRTEVSALKQLTIFDRLAGEVKP